MMVENHKPHLSEERFVFLDTRDHPHIFVNVTHQNLLHDIDIHRYICKLLLCMPLMEILVFFLAQKKLL